VPELGLYWRYAEEPEPLGSRPVPDESALSDPAVLAHTVDPAIQLALQSSLDGFTPETATYAVSPGLNLLFRGLEP
jgi:hypothetical protein